MLALLTALRGLCGEIYILAYMTINCYYREKNMTI